MSTTYGVFHVYVPMPADFASRGELLVVLLLYSCFPWFEAPTYQSVLALFLRKGWDERARERESTDSDVCECLGGAQHSTTHPYQPDQEEDAFWSCCIWGNQAGLHKRGLALHYHDYSCPWKLDNTKARQFDVPALKMTSSSASPASLSCLGTRWHGDPPYSSITPLT